MKKLYLVDVSSMFFRAFYAIRQLSNANGMPTNAVYGFLSMTVKLLREIRPDYMAFCFDRPEPSFRKDMYAEYKANRSEMPEDLVPQVPYIRKLSHALGIPSFDLPGFEADDLIGSLTHFGRKHGLEVVIVSGDKDFGQLVTPHVSIYDTMKDVRYDEAGVLEKWGVEPRKMLDYLALVGDSSDNIPGVSGIGPKGAQKLLTEFDSLEDVYAHLDKISSKSVVQKLKDDRDSAFLSKKLVTIVTDLDLGIGMEDLRLKPIVREELQALLAELDFKNMAKTLLGADPVAPPAPAGEGTTAGASPAAPPSGAGEAPAPQVGAQADVGPIAELEMDVAAIREWAEPEAEIWGLSTERGLFLAQNKTIVRVQGEPEELGRALSGRGLRWKGFDLKEFWKYVPVEDPVAAWDQMLAAYVARAGAIESVHPLFSFYNGESLPELPSPGQLFAAHLRLETNLRRKLATLNSERVLTELDLPLIPVLLEMERAGVRIDVEELQSQSRDLAKDIAALEKDIHKDAGETFNIGSPKQLGQILFEKLKMPTGKKTKTGYSTDNEVLEKCAAEFPICAKVLQWRELAKLKSTYVDALPALVNAKTGRVHTTYKQALTTTGRLSSTNPNLQNIPIRTERGNRVRKAFIAAPGCELVSADYSQIELRILAHITGDAGLTRAFETDADIHTATASEVFETPLGQVTPEMRRKAKAVNFGLAYGQGAYGLAETLRISRGEATEIINRYFTRFPGVKDYMTDTIETAKKQGYVETVFGRRRYIDELFSKSPMVKKFGERAAINAPIQGTASDIVKKAMIALHKKTKGKMLLQVHDELVFETAESDAAGLEERARKEMESVAELRVPLKVNVGRGRNWDDAHS